ncbi:unnamed protein product [Candidatus Paraburkholderia kirkii UZHbot1]|uniref:WGS project CAFE00000000 data, contig bkir_c150 n=1 Tax=Candidatus Paraburkholderia kirkii UZHbot1 TaxID=1055526 RepID=U3UAI9_9BURK|nr:unnamed protein product [Candidatus Paraburkholderia kirkii UZHbot1]
MSKLPDVNQILADQSDTMNAAAAGEAVSRRIGDYADAKFMETGDPRWTEGGEYRIAMHTAGAATVAGLGGGSAIGGAADAAIASIAADKLNSLSDGIAGATGGSDASKALGNIVADVLATAAGDAIAGISGAASAYDVDRYNRQLHPEEKQAIKDKTGNDKAEEDRLTKTACYAVKCWGEFTPGSDQYNANYVSQLEASQLGPELAWVNNQKEAGLFDYTPGQKVTDMVKSDSLGVGKDAAKIAAGGLTVKTGGEYLCGDRSGMCVGRWRNDRLWTE